MIIHDYLLSISEATTIVKNYWISSQLNLNIEKKQFLPVFMVDFVPTVFKKLPNTANMTHLQKVATPPTTAPTPTTAGTLGASQACEGILLQYIRCRNRNSRAWVYHPAGFHTNTHTQWQVSTYTMSALACAGMICLYPFESLCKPTPQ